MARRKATKDFILIFPHTHPYPCPSEAPVNVVSQTMYPGYAQFSTSPVQPPHLSHRHFFPQSVQGLPIFCSHGPLVCLDTATMVILSPGHCSLTVLQWPIPLREKAKAKAWLGFPKAQEFLHFLNSHSLISYFNFLASSLSSSHSGLLCFLITSGHDLSPHDA